MIQISEIEDELANQLDELLIENSTDPQFFGQKYNEYNPQLHIDCFFSGSSTLDEVLLRMDLLKDLIEDLRDGGWELTDKVQDGVLITDFRGQGVAPAEYSMFDEEGFDVMGNHIDEFEDLDGEE